MSEEDNTNSTGPVEKWAVLVYLTQRMKDRFSDEELLTFAKVLAIYTLPDGEPIETPIADRTKNVLTDEELIRAYVRVTGVGDTSTTAPPHSLYDGASLTPEPPEATPSQPVTGAPEGAAPPH